MTGTRIHWLLALGLAWHVGCEGNEAVCGPGTVLEGEVCLRDEDASSGDGSGTNDGEGTNDHDGSVRDSSVVCGERTVLDGNVCVPVEPSPFLDGGFLDSGSDGGGGVHCGEDTVLDGSFCVPIESSSGNDGGTVDGGDVSCGEGTVRDGNVCLPVESTPDNDGGSDGGGGVSCGEGTVLDGNVCVVGSPPSSDGGVDCGLLFVNWNSPVPDGSGDSWATAMRRLDSALATANEEVSSGSCASIELWVAAGVYRPGLPGDRNQRFAPADGVALYGGFAGTEDTRDARDPSLHSTVLSGDLNVDDALAEGSRADNAYVVLDLDLRADSVVVDGFTIESGQADGPFPAQAGAGIHMHDSSAVLHDLVIRDNIAIADGGGMALYRGAPTLSKLRFEGNSALRGGGLHLHESDIAIDGLEFQGNSATDGGAAFLQSSDAVLRSAVFAEDDADGSGGALLIEGGAPTLEDFGITGAQAGNGGALLVRDATVTLDTGVVTDCGSYDDGGALRLEMAGTIEADSVSFEGNTAGGSGGLASVTDGSTLTMTDCTSSEAASGAAGGGIECFDSTVRLYASHLDRSRVETTEYGSRRGGGLYAQDCSVLVRDGSFENGSVTTRSGSYGAGVYAVNSDLTFVRTSFERNVARTTDTSGTPYAEAGALYVSQGSVELWSCTIVDNQVDSNYGSYADYGAIYASGASVRMVNTLVQRNRSDLGDLEAYLWGNSPSAFELLNSTFGGSTQQRVVVTGSGLNRKHNSVFIGTAAEVDPNETRNSCLTLVAYDETDLAETNRDDCSPGGAGTTTVDNGDASLLPADEQDLDDDGDSVEPLPVDLLGEPRVQGAAVDMGAIETAP